MHKLTISLLFFVIASFGTSAEPLADRVVSLDYCADQFALSLLPKDRIKALSPDAEKDFSYMRKAARGVPQVRPIAEDVMLLKPDLVLRSYGGGPQALKFFESLGIPVLQIGYANSVEGIQDSILELGEALGAEDRSTRVVERMNQRLDALPNKSNKEVLYVTQGGVSGGDGTLIGSMIEHAGLRNYQTEPGWRSLPLEALAARQPDIFATAFYDDNSKDRHYWSSARHPVIRNNIGSTQNLQLGSATTACGGWFIIDAIEQLAQKGQSKP